MKAIDFQIIMVIFTNAEPFAFTCDLSKLPTANM